MSTFSTFCVISDGTVAVPLTADFTKQPGTTYYQVCMDDHGTSYRGLIAQIWIFDGTKWYPQFYRNEMPREVRRMMGRSFCDHSPEAWAGAPQSIRSYFEGPPSGADDTSIETV